MHPATVLVRLTCGLEGSFMEYYCLEGFPLRLSKVRKQSCHAYNLQLVAWKAFFRGDNADMEFLVHTETNVCEQSKSQRSQRKSLNTAHSSIAFSCNHCNFDSFLPRPPSSQRGDWHACVHVCVWLASITHLLAMPNTALTLDVRLLPVYINVLAGYQVVEHTWCSVSGDFSSALLLNRGSLSIRRTW